MSVWGQYPVKLAGPSEADPPAYSRPPCRRADRTHLPADGTSHRSTLSNSFFFRIDHQHWWP